MFQTNPVYIGVHDASKITNPTTATIGKLDLDSVDSECYSSRTFFRHVRDLALKPVRKIRSKIWKMKEKNSGFLQWKTEAHQVKTLFYPMRVLLQLVGRFPFSSLSRGQYCRKRENTSRGTSTGGFPPAYEYNMLTVHWLYFIITSLLLFIIFILISIAFTVAFLEWDYPRFIKYPPLTTVETAIFNRNLVPFVLFWSCLLQSNVGDVSFVKNRRQVVDYLNEWENTVRILKLELPVSLRTFLIVSNLWYLAFLAFILVATYFQIIPVAVGGAKVITLLILKPFVKSDPPSGWLLAIGSVTLVYAMYASRALLFIYAYKCRLLRCAFKAWNLRLREQLNPLQYESDVSEVVQCETLYSHHVILTSMVRRTDKVFGGVLQSYYAIQILNMCFELYYLARSGTFVREDESRMDIFAAVTILLQNASVFFTVSLEAAYVHDEAQRGYEILRLRGQQRYDSWAKRLLIRNLLASYSNRIVMTGGKFFVIDRPFIIKVLGAVCTYFVIILQFGDRLTPSESTNSIIT